MVEVKLGFPCYRQSDCCQRSLSSTFHALCAIIPQEKRMRPHCLNEGFDFVRGQPVCLSYLPRDIFCWSNMEESVAQTPCSDNMETGGEDFAGHCAKKTSGRGVPEALRKQIVCCQRLLTQQRRSRAMVSNRPSFSSSQCKISVVQPFGIRI